MMLEVSVAHLTNLKCFDIQPYIVPRKGQDVEFDKVRQTAMSAHTEVEEYLETQRKKLGVKKVR